MSTMRHSQERHEHSRSRINASQVVIHGNGIAAAAEVDLSETTGPGKTHHELPLGQLRVPAPYDLMTIDDEDGGPVRVDRADSEYHALLHVGVDSVQDVASPVLEDVVNELHDRRGGDGRNGVKRNQSNSAMRTRWPGAKREKEKGERRAAENGGKSWNRGRSGG